MRVAFLTHEPFHPPSGGGSAAAIYLVRELITRGHAVEIFGPRLEHAEEVERDFGVRLHAFTAWRMGRTTPLRTPKYLAYPSALSRQVARAIATTGQRFDTVLAQHSISAVAAGQLKRRLGIPIVFNLLDCLTGFMETWPRWMCPRPVARALVRYELGLPSRFHADAVLTVSDGLRDRIIAQGFAPDRVRAIYYGYDSKLFLRDPNPARTGPPTVVMHGSFDQHHLGNIARTAVVETHRRRPEVRFRFVGPRTPSLARFVEAVRRTAPNVPIEETGFTPYERIPNSLADATVGITPYEPSTGTHCAFVAKTVEYLALGLPVVSTPLDSALRYYGNLGAVKFSGPRGEGFADAILQWIDTPPASRVEAVEPARRKVASELDWKVICGRAAEFIEERLPRSQAGNP